jgi:septal ring factor EnvC (AmiA/AmiB activator)
MSVKGYIRKLERELYLTERELQKTEKTITNIETKFGKQHIAFRVYTSKKETLEKEINNLKFRIKMNKEK